MDCYAARGVNSGLVVTGIAVRGARSAPKETLFTIKGCHTRAEPLALLTNQLV